MTMTFKWEYKHAAQQINCKINSHLKCKQLIDVGYADRWYLCHLNRKFSMKFFNILRYAIETRKRRFLSDYAILMKLAATAYIL